MVFWIYYKWNWKMGIDLKNQSLIGKYHRKSSFWQKTRNDPTVPTVILVRSLPQITITNNRFFRKPISQGNKKLSEVWPRDKTGPYESPGRNSTGILHEIAASIRWDPSRTPKPPQKSKTDITHHFLNLIVWPPKTLRVVQGLPRTSFKFLRYLRHLFPTLI